MDFADQYTSGPASKEVTRNGPQAAFRLISDNLSTQAHIDNGLKFFLW